MDKFTVLEDKGRVFLCVGETCVDNGPHRTEDIIPRAIYEGYEAISSGDLGLDLSLLASGEEPGYGLKWRGDIADMPGGIVVMDDRGCYWSEMSDVAKRLIGRLPVSTAMKLSKGGVFNE